MSISDHCYVANLLMENDKSEKAFFASGGRIKGLILLSKKGMMTGKFGRKQVGIPARLPFVDFVYTPPPHMMHH